ncbi:MAG: hypothetical protein IJZ19_13680 [Lentisphaeria bacterium]|nr:hypothetical protein [Lentisphaeria bacterium]
MNRFVKKNIMLVLVFCVALVLVAFLLGLAAVQHARMAKYIKKTEELRDQIKTLHQQKPVPVKENERPLKVNTELYNKAADEIEIYFGQPFKPAVEAFIAELNKKRLPQFKEPWTLERLREAFRDGVPDKDGNQKGWKDIPADSFPEQQMYFENFRLHNFSNWNAAIHVFRENLEKLTTEPLNSDTTVNEILLAQLGVPRVMGFNPLRMNRFLDDYRLKLLDLNNKLGVEAAASDFTFPGEKDKRLFTKEQFPLIPFHMDVIGDLFSKICKTELRQLENIKKRSFEGTQEGSFMRYDYSLEVIGTIGEVRKLVKLIEGAYAERRLYVVRSVFLYQLKDEAAEYISPEDVEDDKNANNDTPSPVETTGRRGLRGARAKQQENTQEPTMSETLKKRLEANRLAELEREKSLKPTERSSYGRLLVGEEKECRAVIDVSYIVKPIPAIQ